MGGEMYGSLVKYESQAEAAIARTRSVEEI